MTRETQQRIDACIEGTLDEAGFAILQQELRADSAALDCYCRQAMVHGRLEWELSPPDAIQPPAAAIAPRRRFRWQIAAAALALLATFTYQATRPSPTPPAAAARTETADFVARLTRSSDAKWAAGSRATGDWLSPGTLTLTHGSAEITFDSGAVIQLQDQATLHIASPSRARLEAGKATVEIPTQAASFILETPSSLLSQAATTFGVAVEPDGSAEIHVLRGRVELNGKSGDLASLMIAPRAPIRIDPSGVLLADKRHRPDQFPAIPGTNRELLPAWFLHWSFDTAATTRDTFRDSGPRPPGLPPFPAEVRLADPKAAVSLLPGRFGNAIHLNGENAFLATQFPGVPGSQPRSIAFWLRVPPGTPETFAYSILSWGSREPGRKWQIGWNTATDNSGPRGAIRTEVQSGFQVGSTNLLDGRWHHVAIVFPGGHASGTGTGLRHYVNGNLEPTTALKAHPIDTRTTGPLALPLSIGRRIEADTVYRTFKGDLDELYIFPTALTPGQILALFQENSPPETR